MQSINLSPRRISLMTRVGNVQIGGDSPIVVQSMTNTDTADVIRTVAQVVDLYRAGSEIVRITVNSIEAAKAVPEIYERLDTMGISVPLVGDFHFNGHKLLTQVPDCASALAKYRINPGNVGRGKKRDSQFSQMIEIACQENKPVRIGVNWGSLDPAVLAQQMDENSKRATPLEAHQVTQEALIQSVLQSAEFAREIGLAKEQIVLSCKLSDVQQLIAVYRKLAKLCDYPLHLGLTEAGMGSKGIVASAAALAVLLQEGIGDTIRISLTPQPGGDRTEEVRVAQELLQTMGIRAFFPLVTSCPGCGRTTSQYFQELAADIQNYLNEQMPKWKSTFPGVESMTVAVMGCVVNGPGESKHANIGISLPGSGEAPVAPVFVDGNKTVTLKGDNIAADFKQIVEQYVSANYN